MRVPLWLKIAWSLWGLLWAPAYWRQYGPQNLLYFCDLGNILTIPDVLADGQVFEVVGTGTGIVAPHRRLARYS